MKNLNFFLVLLASSLIVLSCKDKSGNNKYPELDLLEYGVPLKINAPESSVVTVDDLGIVQDITVRKGDKFYLQIIAGTSYLNSLKEVVEKQKADAISSSSFSKIIEEDEHGFIFEKKYASDRISYDFRYVRLQGDNEYVFQTGLLGQFSLEEVKEMYSAIQ